MPWVSCFLRSGRSFPEAASEEIYEWGAASEARPSVEEILVYDAAELCAVHYQQS